MDYLRLMSLDQSCGVREAAVASICITESTLPDIMKRGRDVNSAVRKAARGKVILAVKAAAGRGDGDGDDEEDSGFADDTMTTTNGDHGLSGIYSTPGDDCL